MNTSDTITINDFGNDVKLNQKIKHLNSLLYKRQDLYRIEGFKRLLKTANSDREKRDVLIGYLNHILTAIRFYDNKLISIQKVNVLNKKKGNNPDILIVYKNEEYAVEIKTINKKKYDENLPKYLDDRDKEEPMLIHEIPDKIENAGYQNPIHTEDFKNIIDQMDRQKKNIIMFLTGFFPLRDFGGTLSDIIYEIDEGYQHIINNKPIEKEKIFLNNLGNEYIGKFAETKKIIVFADISCSYSNIILPEEQNVVTDKEFLDFLKNSNFKVELLDLENTTV